MINNKCHYQIPGTLKNEHGNDVTDPIIKIDTVTDGLNNLPGTKRDWDINKNNHTFRVRKFLNLNKFLNECNT